MQYQIIVILEGKKFGGEKKGEKGDKKPLVN